MRSNSSRVLLRLLSSYRLEIFAFNFAVQYLDSYFRHDTWKYNVKYYMLIKHCSTTKYDYCFIYIRIFDVSRESQIRRQNLKVTSTKFTCNLTNEVMKL